MTIIGFPSVVMLSSSTGTPAPNRLNTISGISSVSSLEEVRRERKSSIMEERLFPSAVAYACALSTNNKNYFCYKQGVCFNIVRCIHLGWATCVGLSSLPFQVLRLQPLPDDVAPEVCNEKSVTGSGYGSFQIFHISKFVSYLKRKFPQINADFILFFSVFISAQF